MLVSIECSSGSYLDAYKDVTKIVKWCNKHASKYYDIISQVDNCILVTSESKVDTPTWCTYHSINNIGTTEKLESKITNSELLYQVKKLADKIKGFNKVNIETFDCNPVGFHPYFLLTKKHYTYCVIINRDNSVDIHISTKIN